MVEYKLHSNADAPESLQAPASRHWYIWWLESYLLQVLHQDRC